MELPPFEPEHLRELEIERLTLDAWACRFDNRGRCRDLSLEALLLADELKYRLGQGLALKNLGFCDYADANFEKALEKLEEALAIARECSSLPLERDCLNFIGATHHRLGDLESAIGAARAVLAINTGLRDEAAITDSLNNFGVLHAEAGDHPEAIRLFREALARECSPHQEALGLANLGRSLVATGAAGEGTEVLRRALRLADDHGLPDVVAPGLVNLAEALTGLGRFDEALEVLDQALEAVRESGSAEGLVHCLLGMARIHAARGHFEAALEAGSRALEAAATLRHRALELEAHGVVTAAHKGLGRYERALFHTERGHAIERELREAASASRLRAVGAQFEVRRARQEAERGHAAILPGGSRASRGSPF